MATENGYPGDPDRVELSPTRFLPALLVLLVGGLVVAVVAGVLALRGSDGGKPEAAIGSTERSPEQLLLALGECQEAAPIDQAIVWLPTDITADKVRSLDGLIGSIPAVETHRYIDAAETYAEFERFFSDEPEIVELVEPGQLPTSFQVRFAAEGDRQSLVDELDGLAAVDEVELTADPAACQAERDALDAACPSLAGSPPAGPGLDDRDAALLYREVCGRLDS